MIRFTVLGSGTSTGVPSVACECPTCTSKDVRDKRLRTSLLVESDTTTVVIDTSLDFRQQMLSQNVLDIDAVVFTHHHFDHIGGFDDIRPYNFRSGKPLAVYALSETAEVLHSTFPYAFGLIESTGASTPSVGLRVIDADPFLIGDIEIVPIPMRHGRAMRVNGYRIGNLAYCTDTNYIPASSREMLKGLDTLILDGLRWEDHPTHFTVDQAITVINDLGPHEAYLTHIAHQIMHERDEQRLPPNVKFAFDGLQISYE
ncbi:MAG: MBL fold metallo-hydrolase [Candidatus Kapabacteria bacterium]|nr:MBL fold metallo-hydrolase [Candidatus Kapabacteria bacterium]